MPVPGSGVCLGQAALASSTALASDRAAVGPCAWDGWARAPNESLAYRLNGGNADNGGLANVNWNDARNQWNNRSFRAQGVSRDRPDSHVGADRLQPTTEHSPNGLELRFEKEVLLLIDDAKLAAEPHEHLEEVEPLRRSFDQMTLRWTRRVAGSIDQFEDLKDRSLNLGTEHITSFSGKVVDHTVEGSVEIVELLENGEVGHGAVR